MRKILRTVYFTSALAPAVVVMSAKHMWQLGPTVEIVSWMFAGLIGCAVPLLIVKAIYQRSEVLPVTIRKAEPVEWPLFVATFTYLIPLGFGGLTFEQLAFIIGLAALMLSAIDAVPFHPILHAFRYRFYKVEIENSMTYWLVARSRILDPARIKRVREIAPGLIMEDV